MFDHLEIPKIETLKILERDQDARRAARRLLHETARRIEKFSSLTAVVLATNTYPEVSPADAVENLAAEVKDCLEKIADFETRTRAASDAEHERQRPIVSFALKRLMHLEDRPEAIENQLRQLAEKERQKSETLRKVGLGDERISTLLDEEFAQRRAELIVRARETREERDAWRKFMKTLDEADCPPVEMAM
jgi:hypothetical protein